MCGIAIDKCLEDSLISSADYWIMRGGLIMSAAYWIVLGSLIIYSDWYIVWGNKNFKYIKLLYVAWSRLLDNELCGAARLLKI